MFAISVRQLFGLVLFTGLVAACGGYSSSASPSAPSPTPSTPSPAPSPSPSPAPSGSPATAVSIPPNARNLTTTAFVPNPANVAQASVVTWSNTDSITHDIVSDTGVWDSGRLGPNENFKFTFATKGTFPYHCSIHPNMTGTIVVQ